MQFSFLHKSKVGFTLVELMIVIAIVGILVSALVPGYAAYIQRGRDTARVGDITDLSKAITLHFSEFDYYPLSTSAGCVDDAVLLKYTDGTPRHDPLTTNWNGCNDFGRYGYATSTGLLNNPNVFSLLAIMEQPFAGNYNGSLDGFTGTLTASAYYTGTQLLEKWAWPYYIRVP